MTKPIILTLATRWHGHLGRSGSGCQTLHQGAQHDAAQPPQDLGVSRAQGGNDRSAADTAETPSNTRKFVIRQQLELIN
jgi:hypothetical protein